MACNCGSKKTVKTGTKVKASRINRLVQAPVKTSTQRTLKAKR